MILSYDDMMICYDEGWALPAAAAGETTPEMETSGADLSISGVAWPAAAAGRAQRPWYDDMMI